MGQWNGPSSDASIYLLPNIKKQEIYRYRQKIGEGIQLLP